ncbi:hypothetical protein Psal071_00799 [Piscirickettsia salmonis]|uniref:Uncharacterized protein n=1 Tax=Piscirickettsia salmonis TaxID=1238 RepID=A0A9Q6PS50_PISSA|nr:hypothetical protein [Piscirickettsia salmonis]QGN95877.1 hypothetical protein Psal006a_02505 [Piscirickettsia salmonis]QGO05172.1 hypothetical protein Psal009_01053 [Piscirickettsia salmonis]QGO33493.1 hypothetical protein Psal028_00800 [Piscirickettsia salmonis]QGO37105.1 hypothetical protein Psal040_00800 [Piscirickettsia salmonis]QGO40729.1 hypothetical protein Psal041_00799 [Piscirickettsia salmonis]
MLFEDLQASVLRLLEHVAISLPVAQPDGNFEEEVHRAISFLSKLEKQVERAKSAEVLLDILVCLQESHLVGAYDSVLQDKLLAEYILACEEMVGIAAKEIGVAAKEIVEWGQSLRDELLVAGVALTSEKDSELSITALEMESSSELSLSDEEIVLDSEVTAQEADSPDGQVEVISQHWTEENAALLAVIRQRYNILSQKVADTLKGVEDSLDRLPPRHSVRVDVQQSDDTGTLNQVYNGELVAEPSTSALGAGTSNQLSVGVQVVEQSANIPETESSHQSSTSLQVAGPSTSALEAEIFLQSSVSDEDESISTGASLSLEQQAQSVGQRAEVTGRGFDLCERQLENFKKQEAACEQRLDNCVESLTTLEIRIQHLQQMLSARRQKLGATSTQTAEPTPRTPEAGPSHQSRANDQTVEPSPSTPGAGASHQSNMNIQGGPSAQQRLDLVMQKIVRDAQAGRFELGIGGSTCSISVNGGRSIEVPKRIAQILLIIQANQDGLNFTPEDKLRRIQAIQAVADEVQHRVFFFFARTQPSTNVYIKNLDCGD